MAVAKIPKYASSASGDTIEMIERPSGGLSFVLVDGQWSGKPAKRISNVVARKAISLLAEGVRDGAAARAASDYLYTYREGKVQATLNILSIDLITQTLVITRNSPAPVILVRGGEMALLDSPTESVGTRRGTRPSITEVQIEPNLAIIVYTDGLMHAGDRHGETFDIPGTIADFAAQGPPNPQVWADALLARALELDRGRPGDDMSILVAATLPRTGDQARRLTARMPLS